MVASTFTGIMNFQTHSYRESLNKIFINEDGNLKEKKNDNEIDREPDCGK
jgi:hypothetical protein